MQLDPIDIAKNIEEKRLLWGKKLEGVALSLSSFAALWVRKIFSAKLFLPATCSIIFLLSIFLRSTIDIGADTAFYLDLGQRIAAGKKYYYDFFESNFPLSFYFYALQYRLAVLSGISPIIMSEIFVNVLGVLSLLASAKILQRSNLYHKQRNAYNIIIIGFCAAFFWRIVAIQIGEFGTKTSFFLIIAFPYIAYSFLDNKTLATRSLICRGVLMGLMPCLKPHYIILVIFIESYKFWQKKLPQFFLEIDKLVFLMVMALYLNFLIIVTPEFLEFMVPMWSEFYHDYADANTFMRNCVKHFSNKFLLFSLISPMFWRVKILAEDKILLIVFFAVATLVTLENIGTIDQETIFFGLASTCLFKFAYDFFSSKYFSFAQNKLAILIFIFIPIFDIENFYLTFFSLLNVWFFVIAALFFHYFKQQVFDKKIVALYLFLTAISIYAKLFEGSVTVVLVNILSFIIFLHIFEKKYNKLHNKFSPILVIIVTGVVTYFAYSYIATLRTTFLTKEVSSSPTKITDDFVGTIKAYAPKADDGYLVFSGTITSQFPLMTYLQNQNNYKYAVVMALDEKNFSAKRKTRTMFSLKPRRVFVFGYLLDDLKKQMHNANTKIIFADQNESAVGLEHRCSIHPLEYYLQDSAFRKIFLQNFRFQGRITEYKKSSEKLLNSFDESVEKLEIMHDYEIYVRR